ncbi:hypothetical protein D7Y41_14780 [Anaerotruncus sp. 1XD22-93]|nr:hypothetical protein [Lachnospiraceae bacterium]NBI75299.1 hypothetical protein [Lachnospiraceae bacterium]RKJ93635.1 hypothetical protein D7Y41_14780 [Anaerotruncus sp. 1XD22-93]
MKNKKNFLAVCMIFVCMFAALMVYGKKAEAAPYPSIEYTVTLKPGEVSEPFHPSMTDYFKSYSISDTSVCDITYTDPSLISIVAKKPGKAVVTFYGEFRDYFIYVTVEEPASK